LITNNCADGTSPVALKFSAVLALIGSAILRGSTLLPGGSAVSADLLLSHSKVSACCDYASSAKTARYVTTPLA
jgi:hypothetical protein